MVHSIESLPRLRELHDRFCDHKRANFFTELPNRLAADGGVTFHYYAKVENWLGYVPTSQWEAYCGRIRQTTNIHLKYRYWERLHDVFNEALGAKILTTRYRCREINLISARQIKGKQPKAPDWVGSSLSKTTYIEVKTLNHSQRERESWYSGAQLPHRTKVPLELEAKIKSTYELAIDQLSRVGCPQNRKLVLFVYNRDYNFDPIDESIKSVLCACLDNMERKDFPILVHIQGP